MQMHFADGLIVENLIPFSCKPFHFPLDPPALTLVN
jgi:hypothetical protein